MLVPHDQQTRKPASTVSPHFEQVHDWVADISGDKCPRAFDAGAVSEADPVTRSAGEPSRPGSGTGVDTVRDPGSGSGLGCLHPQHRSAEASTAAPH